ncbi:hypothetical protein FRC01_013002, partial [Tulasnella sp. 417]
MNGEEVDATDSGRSREPSRASSKAPPSTKGRGAPSQSEESVHEVAAVSKTGGGPSITVGAQNVGFFIDTHGDDSLQQKEGPSRQGTTATQLVEEKAVSIAERNPNIQHPTVNGSDVLLATKTSKSPPQAADGSETSGAATPTAPLDIEEEGAGQAGSGADKPKAPSKSAAKKARRREREKVAAESSARTGAQAQDNSAAAALADGASAMLFFEDMEGFTVAGHLQPDPVEEPLPTFITVDGLTLPRHVKLEKEDTKTKADVVGEDGNPDDSTSEESDDEIESDDDDDDRPKKGRRYWLTEEQLATIPPCG